MIASVIVSDIHGEGRTELNIEVSVGFVEQFDCERDGNDWRVRPLIVSTYFFPPFFSVPFDPCDVVCPRVDTIVDPVAGVRPMFVPACTESAI